ncbi:MAG: hypothetical protein NT006_04715 [Candidatus Aminicenantes bacterium]|nr:hypothetical protein [Candidatus Aminicenantes bacterium]
MLNFGTFADLRDGRVYKTIKIGSQTWFAENLAYIPHVSPGPVQGGIWVYGNDGSDVEASISAENYKTYGCLYDWETAVKISPNGWHLPSEEDWVSLARYFGGRAEDGNKMKEVDTGYWKNCHFNADNSSGFSALPGGARSPDGEFFSLNSEANFWSSTESYAGHFWHYYLEDISPYVRSNPNDKTYGYSIRYIKDE